MRETLSSLLGRNLYQIGSFVFSIILPCHQIVHSRRLILARKPRCPTGNARTRERLRIARMRDLGYLVEKKPSARSGLPSRDSIRGIPRFSCQNLALTVYFLREETRHLLNIRRIPKNPGLLVCRRAGLLTCLTARQRVRFNRQKRTRLKSSTSQRRAR